jgi:hypothetical protein
VEVRREVKPIEMAVRAKASKAKPALHSVTPTQVPVTPAKVNCYVDFPLPLALMANGIQVDAKPNQLNVYFTQGSGIVIGRLTP